MSEDTKIPSLWSLRSGWGEMYNNMVKYKASQMVIRDTEKNNAGKGAGIMEERTSMMGPFTVCLLIHLLKNRH